ncbi:hypothetical protein [Yinghuangia sp. YIM S10712]|uniref:hypothetical protein n=1 Tax=Yinghuangia sp. YIM S10712 TaxID=3436930 RepID=UPI003F53BDE6
MTTTTTDPWNIPQGHTIDIPRAEAITGWRAEWVFPARGGALLYNFRDGHLSARPAECLEEHDHPVPDPECHCGYRVVRDLHHLAAYWKAYRRTDNTRGKTFPVYAIARVRGFGRIARPRTDPQYIRDDPPGTVRVSRMSIARTIYAPRDRAHYFADGLESFYSLVDVRIYDHLDDLIEGETP